MYVCKTYGSILGSLRAAALECDPVALVLETLRSDQTLDLGGLGVGLCALLLGLDLTADDELADLQKKYMLVSNLENSQLALRLNHLRNAGLAKKL